MKLLLKTQSGKEKVLSANVGDTLLDVAHKNSINIDGTCDGDLNCSTCHCVVDKKIFDELPDSKNIMEKERDLLE